MHITNLLLLAGALGASAHPGHGHAHRDVHEKRGVHYKAIHKTVTKAVTTTAAATTSTPVAAATTSSKAAAATSSTGTGSYVEFCSGATKRELVEYTEKKRTTAAQIAYVGNTGTAGNWGCNMMAVASNIVSLYNYTASFTNVASESYSVGCFNKVGPTGLLDGSWNTAVSFTVAPGETKYVAFEANTQGACAFGPGSLPKTSLGQLSGSWAEIDFENASNGGWSGADCSSLVAQAYSQTVPGCRCCNDANTCSTILPGGVGTNAYIAGTEDESGIGINQIPGSWQLKIDLGYSG